MTLAGKPPHFKQVVVDEPKGGFWMNILGESTVVMYVNLIFLLLISKIPLVT